MYCTDSLSTECLWFKAQSLRGGGLVISYLLPSQGLSLAIIILFFLGIGNVLSTTYKIIIGVAVGIFALLIGIPVAICICVCACTGACVCCATRRSAPTYDHPATHPTTYPTYPPYQKVTQLQQV